MKTIIIGLPVSPATRISAEAVDVTKILISFGGGMGGTNQTFYATYIEDHGDEIEIVDVMQRAYILNKKFIVMQEQAVVVEDIVDMTAHSNYDKKICESSISHRFILINQGDTYQVIGEYDSTCDAVHSYEKIER